MNKKITSPIHIWGKPRRQRLWHRCLDLIQHSCVIAAFVVFLSYVQSVTAAESNNAMDATGNVESLSEPCPY